MKPSAQVRLTLAAALLASNPLLGSCVNLVDPSGDDQPHRNEALSITPSGYHLADVLLSGGGGSGSIPPRGGVVYYYPSIIWSDIELSAGLFFDDHIYWHASKSVSVTLCDPRVLIYRQLYPASYLVDTSDPGDFDVLSVSAHGDGTSGLRIDFWLLDDTGTRIGSSHNSIVDPLIPSSFVNVVFADDDDPSVVDGDDLLGNQDGTRIGGFELELRVEPAGSRKCVEIGGFWVDIEFADLEP